MKLNGKLVDSRITNALKAELSQVGDNELLNFVASVSYLNVGFRKVKMPAAVALTGVCAELDKPQELTGNTTNTPPYLHSQSSVDDTEVIPRH
jgi:hypothetical protein